MRFKNKKLFIGIATSTAALAVGCGVAFAAWSASGSGSGTGAATVAQSLVVTPVTPAGANASMYPGGPAGAVFFNIRTRIPTPSRNHRSVLGHADLDEDQSVPELEHQRRPRRADQRPQHQRARRLDRPTSITGVLDLSTTADPAARAWRSTCHDRHRRPGSITIGAGEQELRTCPA